MQDELVTTFLQRTAISTTQPFAQSLNVFKYTIPLSLSNLHNGKLWCKTWLKSIIFDISRQINKHHLITLQLYPGLFELYNVRYTEKWVKRIDENFLEYHAGSRPSLNVPSRQLPRNLKYLSTKFFSGDVSGTIAESLFIYFLHSIGIDINFVGHLRPHKREDLFTPDFIIYDEKILNARIGNIPLISISNCRLPIYAEVKGSTSQIKEDRIEKALLQLNQVIRESQDCGLIFIAYKNPNYEGIIFEVRL
jgi:hypothetical protein